MNNTEAYVWSLFTIVVRKFFAGMNFKSDNYSKLAGSMLCCFRYSGSKMRIKVHYLHDHLDRFPETHGDLIDEQGK